MASCIDRITFRVSFAWWAQPYIAGVRLCSLLSGLEPDMGKVERVVLNSLRVERVRNG